MNRHLREAHAKERNCLIRLTRTCSREAGLAGKLVESVEVGIAAEGVEEVG